MAQTDHLPISRTSRCPGNVACDARKGALRSGHRPTGSALLLLRNADVTSGGTLAKEDSWTESAAV